MKRIVGYLDIVLAVPFLIAALLSLWGAVETWDRLTVEPEDFQISMILLGVTAWVGISAFLAGRVLIRGASGGRSSANRAFRASAVALVLLALSFAVGLADEDPVSHALLFLLIPAVVLLAVTCFLLRKLASDREAAPDGGSQGVGPA